MRKHFYQYLVLFLVVAILGFGCLAASLKMGGIGGLGYTFLAMAFLWPLYGIDKAMYQELSQLS